MVYQPPKIEGEPVDIDAIEPDLNIDFEENSPQQEGIIYEVYERPGKEYLQESLELDKQGNSKNLVQRHLPKQADLDKILKIIQRKNIKGNTFTCYHEGDPSGIFNQSIHQGCLFVFSA